MTRTQMPRAKIDELRAYMGSGEPFTLSDLGDRFGIEKRLAEYHRRAVERSGVTFVKTREGLRVTYRAKVRRSTSKDLVHVPRAHPIVNGRGRVGPGAAAASLAPSLDASLTVDLLKREADGSITVGMVNGSMRYLFALTGAIPMEMAEP